MTKQEAEQAFREAGFGISDRLIRPNSLGGFSLLSASGRMTIAIIDGLGRVGRVQ